MKKSATEELKTSIINDMLEIKRLQSRIIKIQQNMLVKLTNLKDNK